VSWQLRGTLFQYSASYSCWLQWAGFFFAKITTHKFSRTVKTTKCFSTV